MATRALVLGGGGPVGIGWETGMISGFQEEGVDVTDADVIIGTSAGAAVGTQIASGQTPAELLAEQFAQLDDGAGLTVTPDMPALTAIGQKWIGGAGTDAVRAEIGALAVGAKTPSEEEWLVPFQKALLSPEWPDRRLVITGVDTGTGEFVTWERASGVDLAHAVTASCAVPGLFPPVAIDGRHYMDGGVHSVSNAQLAQGYERIVIIAASGAGDNPYDKQYSPPARGRGRGATRRRQHCRVLPAGRRICGGLRAEPDGCDTRPAGGRSGAAAGTRRRRATAHRLDGRGGVAVVGPDEGAVLWAD